MMQQLLKDIRNCKECSQYLTEGVNPIIAASVKSRIVIIGQAPGLAVHKTGIPWNDKSGDNLRSWLDVEKASFYNPDLFALIPMGFCYPGKGKSGDLPPRKECAPLWHKKLLESLGEVKIIVLIGKYAQDYYLKEKSFGNLTENVRNFKTFLPGFFLLPHPSPRNNIWKAKNSWFENEVIPELKETIKQIIK